MSKKLTNVQKVALAMDCTFNMFSDGSASWIEFETETHSINICFDGKGDKFTEIIVAEKIYAVVDEKVIARISK